MEMEFYHLHNTLTSYKKSIIHNLETVDRKILEIMEDFDTTTADETCTRKYALSQEMVKILQIYIKILFLTEKLVNGFRHRQNHDSEENLNNFCNISLNPFILSVMKSETEKFSLHVETKQEIEQNVDDIFSETSSGDTDASTETLVDITNKLLEDQYKNQKAKMEVDEIKTEDAIITEDVIKGEDAVKTEDVVKAENVIKTEDVINTEDAFKTKAKAKEKIEQPKNYTGNDVNKNQVETDSKPVQNLPSTRSVKFPLNYRPIVYDSNETVPLLKSNNSHKKVCIKLETKFSNETPSKSTDNNNRESYSNKSEIKSSQPTKCVQSETNSINLEIESVNDLNKVKEPRANLSPSSDSKAENTTSNILIPNHSSAETSKKIKPESLPSESTAHSPTQNNSLRLNKSTNPFVNTTQEIYTSPSSDKRSEPKYTAITKLLNMSFHDRKKEAEKRYEGQYVVEDFKWKTVPKTPMTPSDKKKEKPSKYVIADDTLRVNQRVTFSCVNDPSNFYVRPNQELFESLENSFNEDLNNTYQYVVANYESKSEARAVLGDFCFIFLSDKHKWFRVQVVDWMEEDGERVMVHLIDYGDHYFCRYKNLKAMMELYSEFPKMAVKCHFAGIYSPKSDKTQWPEESISALKELSEMKIGTQFVVIYAHKEEDSYAVDLTKGDSDETVAQLLVKRKVVLEEVLPSLMIISEEDDEDDLVEFDGINEAITGYDAKDEARICRFTDSSGRCFKGPKCKLEHIKLPKDGITTDQVLSATQAMEKLKLPATGENVTILITGYVNTCHFYAQIIRNRSKSDMFNDEFQLLKDNMNANNLVQTYEMFKVYPGIGELVLVKHNNEWHRAICVSHEGQNCLTLFLVDFGIKVYKKMKDVRQIKDDFLYLPFQAVECMLSSCCEIDNASAEVSWGFFQNCMQFQNFTAHVVESREPLQLQLWDANGLEMDYVLKQYGLGQDRSVNLWPKDDNILTLG